MPAAHLPAPARYPDFGLQKTPGWPGSPTSRGTPTQALAPSGQEGEATRPRALWQRGLEGPCWSPSPPHGRPWGPGRCTQPVSTQPWPFSPLPTGQALVGPARVTGTRPGHFLVSLSWKPITVTRHPTPVLLPGKSHGWRSLVGCSPWGR